MYFDLLEEKNDNNKDILNNSIINSSYCDDLLNIQNPIY